MLSRRTPSPIAGAIIVLFLSVTFFTGVLYMAFHQKTGVYDQPGSIHRSFRPGTPVMHILFLGDSYTFVNDLPLMVAEVAASDTVYPLDIEPGMYAKGNATLDDLWRISAAHNALNSRHWDDVVLQEHSMETLQDEWIPVMRNAMTEWNEVIRQAGSRTVIYETWARKPGSDWYDVRKYSAYYNFGNPASMQDRVDKVTNAIAASIQAPVVPVGDYWAACMSLPGAPQLYNQDGTHPSLAGDYMIALLFYRELTGRRLDHITFIPNGLPPEDALFLRRCASY